MILKLFLPLILILNLSCLVVPPESTSTETDEIPDNSGTVSIGFDEGEPTGNDSLSSCPDAEMWYDPTTNQICHHDSVTGATDCETTDMTCLLDVLTNTYTCQKVEGGDQIIVMFRLDPDTGLYRSDPNCLPTPSLTICGNGLCEEGEDEYICPVCTDPSLPCPMGPCILACEEDCFETVPTCGNTICEGGEDEYICPVCTDPSLPCPTGPCTRACEEDCFDHPLIDTPRMNPDVWYDPATGEVCHRNIATEVVSCEATMMTCSFEEEHGHEFYSCLTEEGGYDIFHDDPVTGKFLLCEECSSRPSVPPPPSPNPSGTGSCVVCFRDPYGPYGSEDPCACCAGRFMSGYDEVHCSFRLSNSYDQWVLEISYLCHLETETISEVTVSRNGNSLDQEAAEAAYYQSDSESHPALCPDLPELPESDDDSYPPPYTLPPSPMPHPPEVCRGNHNEEGEASFCPDCQSASSEENDEEAARNDFWNFWRDYR
ncbi:MAG: hypothetical protein HY539_02270 [Deltaproteobacteria bacterium]|nr:hypothetical protein [Deltaproteobacteria bacterium]